MMWEFYFFFSNLDSFYFFFCSDCCGPKLPKLCWIVVVKVGTPVLFLTLGEMLSIFLPLRITFAEDLSYIPCIMLRYVPSIPAFWRVFIINECWILSKTFSASTEMIIWLLFSNMTHGGFMLMYGKTIQYCKVISLQLK